MGIKVEFNPDLALRRFGTLGRQGAECLPEKLMSGIYYDFLKEGQRCYWFGGEIPLLETEGNERLSRPIASILIVKATHYLEVDGNVWTRGKYLVKKVYDANDPKIHFEGMNQIKSEGGADAPQSG